ncbi:MAG: ParB/RepB/Spo0J family partition protein [Candidatus Liptonbacteria bacterium]
MYNDDRDNSLSSSSHDSGLGRGLESLIPSQNSPVPDPASGISPLTHSAQDVPVAAEEEPLDEKKNWAWEAAKKNKERLQASRIEDAIFHVEVNRVFPNPEQPRRNFDPEALKELAASIREFGLLQPIVVTKVEHETAGGTQVEYQLISGERRLQAVKLLGLETIPAIIRNIKFEKERLELAIIENIQREDLNPIEMARAFARLQDEFRMTQREVAARLGKSREAVANTMRLLDLPAHIREAIEKNQISESHGRLLLSVDNPSAQERLFQDLLTQGMTTRELKNKVRAASVPKHYERHSLPAEIKIIQERLSSELGAPVEIDAKGEGAGRITINFFSEEELRQILEKIAGAED